MEQPNSQNENANKALLGTTHKLPHCTRLRTVHTYRVQPVGRPQNADVQQMRSDRQNPNALAEG